MRGNRPLKVAFIHAVFPGLTTTFVNREFEFLDRQTDLEVYPISIKRPEKELFNEEYKHYAPKTLYLRPDAFLGILLYNFLALCSRPVKYFNTMRTILLHPDKYTITDLVKVWFHVCCGIYLSYYLKRQKIEVIHAHFDTAVTMALAAHLFSGIPFFLTLHANEMYTGDAILEVKMQHATKIITNNRYNQKHINLLTHYKYQDKINVIYNGLDLEQFEGAWAKTERSDPMRLVSIGSFRGFKGYPTVLTALSQLRQQGLAFSYTIIGDGNKDEREMIHHLIKSYGLEEHTILLGRQPFSRVRQELEEADLEIMASEIFDRGFRDGFPNVVIEAMLLKRPVVTTYISDIPTLIKHGETGYLFPEKNASDLADILGHLYHHYQETLPVVERAYQVAVQTFNAKINYSTLAQVLRSYP